jgi:hypothetical protein
MQRFFRIWTLAVLALGATALTAQAQDKATELTAGILGLQVTSVDGNDNSLFEVATGGAFVSMGFYLNPGLAVEPTLSGYLASSDGDNFSTFTIGVAVPYYFQKGWGRKGVYLAPRVNWTNYSATDVDSQSQFGLGVALGTKVALNDAAALRIQGSFDYGFEGDLPSTTAFGASLGLSVFLK